MMEVQTQANARAADAYHALSALLGALIDHPRILTECAGFSDLAWLADGVAAKAVTAHALAADLDRAAVVLRGLAEVRRAA